MTAPAPAHILRLHNAQISALGFSADNSLIFSGDSDGTVCIVLCKTLRPVSVWKAHQGGILGVEQWGDSIITHGRDNKLHVWAMPRILETISDGALSELEKPELLYSLDVNALNYCRFSLIEGSVTDPSSSNAALVALPNLVDSTFMDIWELPCLERRYAAVGKATHEPVLSAEGERKTGIVMSMYLYRAPSGLGSRSGQLRIFAGYEDGGVILYAYDGLAPTSIEGQGWVILWSAKVHKESVMHLAVSPDLTFGLTISADHLIGKYSLRDGTGFERTTIHRTKHPGNGAVAIRSDGRVCAVAGWDGRVRLYSTKSFKSLGTLVYHRDSCYAVSFATLRPPSGAAKDEDSDEEGDAEKRCRWLITGGKDTRVAVWELMDFDRRKDATEAASVS